MEAPSTAFFAIVCARLVRATAIAMKPSETHLQRQVDTLLASLEGALESDGVTPTPIVPPPLLTAASSSVLLPSSTAAPSPFSMSAGALFPARGIGAAPVTMPAVPPPGAANALTLEQLEAQLNAPAAEPAPCLPYDFAAYLSRLSTFRAGANWFDKPPPVSPPQCARYGWTLTGHNLLTCNVCGACLKAPEHMVNDPEVLATLVSQLTTAHGELCPWRGNPSPDTIAALLLPGSAGTPPSLPHGVSIGREAIRVRASSLLSRLTVLPKLSPEADSAWSACAAACGYADDLDGWKAAVLTLSGLEKSLSTLSAIEGERRWVAAALAILGWQAGTTTPNTIECPEDARTVGLWSYETVTRAGAEATAAAAAPATALFGMAARSPFATATTPTAETETTTTTSPAGSLPLFDPILEHRSWSPWTIVSEGDDVPAWMRTLSLLLLPAWTRSMDAAGRSSGASGAGSNSSAAAVSRLLSAF